MPIDQQADHREMSTEKIKRRIQNVEEGDEVLFNDRKRSLTISRTYDPQRWVTVHIETKEDVREVFKHQSEVESLEEGQEATIKTSYKFRGFKISGIVSKIGPIESEYFDEYALHLEGPRDGIYLLHVPSDTVGSQYQDEKRVAARNVSANRPSDETVYWFKTVR